MATQARALAAFPPTLRRRQPRCASHGSLPTRKEINAKQAEAREAERLASKAKAEHKAACADSKATKTAYLLAKDAVPVLRKAAAELKEVAAKLKVEAKEIKMTPEALVAAAAKRAAKAAEKEEDRKAYRAKPYNILSGPDGVYRWSSDGVDHEYTPLYVKNQLAAAAKAAERAQKVKERADKKQARADKKRKSGGAVDTPVPPAPPPLNRHVLRGRGRGTSNTKRKRGWEAQAMKMQDVCMKSRCTSYLSVCMKLNIRESPVSYPASYRVNTRGRGAAGPQRVPPLRRLHQAASATRLLGSQGRACRYETPSSACPG